jgi:hypothetical protein
MVVEECQKRRLTDTTFLAFFYCKHGDPQRNTFSAIARGILSQLLLQSDDLLPYLFDKSLTSGETVLESLTLAKELLETVLKSLGKVYIIIDGLDECKRDEKVMTLSWFLSIAGREVTFMKCLFVSQDDGCIGKFLDDVPTIHTSAAGNGQDIRSYVHLWSERIQSKFAISDAMKEEIFSNVVGRADGDTLSKFTGRIFY